MTSTLDRLCGASGPLRAEPADTREFASLLRSGKARIGDAMKPGLSLESRFDLAYNAAHAFSLAALRRLDYRPSQRYIVFQLIPQTMGLGPEVWRVLAKCHDLRNRNEYEGDAQIDARLVEDLSTACLAVAHAVEALAPP